MRDPVRRLKLYEAMKSDIVSGVYLSGGFMPNEFELAVKYGYSRDTVRSALAMLEDDKLVELLKGKGRRICPANVEKAKVPLTFLLPCPDFLCETASFVNAQMTRRMLKGVSQVAFEYDCRVETVPVSPTNNAHEIDWRKLNFVNADSRLVVNGYWYRDLFPLLMERGCKMAFIEDQAPELNDYKNYVKEWFLLSMDRLSTMESAVKFLAECGCRRIALAHNYIAEKDHPVLHGYKSGLAKYGLRYIAWHDTLMAKDDSVREIIGNFYKKNNFDGLLLDPMLIFRIQPRHSVHQYLGLPANVKIITTREISYNQMVFPSLTSMDFQYEEIGMVAAQHLLEEKFIAGQQLFSAKVIKRESTMLESDQLSLITT
jgi:DNA-binding LacI/PurR family transcriptional regulator